MSPLGANVELAEKGRTVPLTTTAAGCAPSLAAEQPTRPRRMARIAVSHFRKGPLTPS